MSCLRNMRMKNAYDSVKGARVSCQVNCPVNEEYLHTNVLIKHFVKYNSDDLSHNM
jgi:hypothetical protein